VKVLIVEDDVSVCNMYKQILEDNTSFEIHVSNSYNQAKSELENNKFDVIILDLYLSKNKNDLTGINLATGIRKTDLNTQIIVITGYPSNTIINEAIALNIYDYLQKPIDMNYFVKTIQRAMEKKILLDERDELQNQITKTHEDIDFSFLGATFKELYNNKKSYKRLSEVQATLQLAVKKLISSNVNRFNKFDNPNNSNNI